MGFGDVIRDSVERISSLFEAVSERPSDNPIPHHLGVRVPWHDARWDGTVCRAPSRNAFCLDLDGIRDQRNDELEDTLGGRHFADLPAADLPPCRAESGAFMSSREWWLPRSHPYATVNKAATTHGSLRPTSIRMEPYSTLAVPFWWMLRQNQGAVDRRTADCLPPDKEPPFASPWVFGRERQEGIGNWFFGRLAAGSSLVTFYTKSGHPLGEDINRLVVGIGRIDGVGPVLRYDSVGDSTYPLWERSVHHSVRPDGADGFLLPYHDYLAGTGDPDEDVRRSELVREIALVPEPAHIAAYSYAGELAGPDITLSTAVRALDAVRAVRRHGIAPGPWLQREEWLNTQIAALWRDRGSFPGTGAALEAMGLRLGTALFHALLASGTVGPDDDPWTVVDALFHGRLDPPDEAFRADVEASARTWIGLPPERRELLVLLSRFAMSPAQSRRWFDPKARASAIRGACDDSDVIANPYRIAECDLGDQSERPVTVGVLDRGLMPDDTTAVRHPVPEPSHVGSSLDWRRIRAGMVAVLRRAAEDGDALLARDELRTRLAALDLTPRIDLSPDWPDAHVSELSGEIELVTATGSPDTAALQLLEHREGEDKLRSVLGKRARRTVPSLKVDWTALISAAIADSSTSATPPDERGALALAEQADALERITTRRLSVLVGRAGTGKTTVLSALLGASALSADGVLFLAPTGKASVQIAMRAPDAEVRTVASFLYSLGRYDGTRQRPRMTGTETYRGARTVVIDEASMLTMDVVQALLAAIDLAHVRRVVLVGDPNQLPPIGVGRPFADLVAHLDELPESDPGSGALARLTTELRTRSGGETSDALQLAAWYTRESQAVDADSVLDALDGDAALNDLTVRVWRSQEELYSQLDELLVKHLELASADDVESFNGALGLTPEGWVPFGADGAPDHFQILSPVRQHAHGVNDLNRRIQSRFRAPQLRKAAGRGGVALGDESIVWGDKVILNRNGQRKGWDFGGRAEVKEFLANGEVGFVGKDGHSSSTLVGKFARRTDRGFRFRKSEFGGAGGPLSLAYALTIHKSQGSEFGTVFVVVPQHSRLLTRELVYTALTRARDHVVLLVEADVSVLHGLTLPERSETARRNTNLFTGAVRLESIGVPYAGHLIHRTVAGTLVRSKSELVIANHLESEGIEYRYEQPLIGEGTKDRRWPDFSFVSDAGDLIVWEHLGMLDRPDYRAAWERKRKWYDDNGFAEGIDLFTTADRAGALDSAEIAATADRVRKAIG